MYMNNVHRILYEFIQTLLHFVVLCCIRIVLYLFVLYCIAWLCFLYVSAKSFSLGTGRQACWQGREERIGLEPQMVPCRDSTGAKQPWIFLLHVAFPKAQISERLLENPAVRHFLLTFEEQDPFAVPDWNVSSWGLDGIGFMFFAELCLSDGPRTLRLLGGLDLFEFQVLSKCSQTLRCQMSFYHEDWPDLLPCIASIGIQARKCISDSWHTIMISHDVTEMIFWL